MVDAERGSWEWFEEFREENDALVQSASPNRDISERERIEGYLKSPFKTPTNSEGEYVQTDFGGLIESYAEIAELMRALIAEVLASRFLEYAHGQQLDYIAREVRIDRWDGEGDESFRARVRAGFREIISGGTIPEIRSSIAALLGVDLEENPNAIQIIEPFDETVAYFDVSIEPWVFDETPIPESYVDEHVRKMKAAGVGYAEIEEPDWFEFRDEAYSTTAGEDERGDTHGWARGRWIIAHRDYWYDD